MFLLLRIVFFAVAVLVLAFGNKGSAGVSFFGLPLTLPVSLVILLSVFLGFLLNRWVEEFRQISLSEIIRQYAQKTARLEKALAEKGAAGKEEEGGAGALKTTAMEAKTLQTKTYPSPEIISRLKDKIRNIPDFPIPGILFRDITPLLQDAQSFKAAIDCMVARFKGAKIGAVAAIESRGYILASAVAYALGVGFVPIRKIGKLPAEKISQSYTLEYGENVLEMHKDAVEPGQNILIVDDLIATGGSALATKKLVEAVGGKVAGFAFLVELKDLNGRKLLEGTDVFALLEF